MTCLSTRFLNDLRPHPKPTKLNADQTVAVATDVFWNEDMTTAPRGTKCQLLGAGGVATYGVYNGDPFWQALVPLAEAEDVSLQAHVPDVILQPRYLLAGCGDAVPETEIIPFSGVIKSGAGAISHAGGAGGFGHTSSGCGA
jgi:hypothetical protein